MTSPQESFIADPSLSSFYLLPFLESLLVQSPPLIGVETGDPPNPSEKYSGEVLTRTELRSPDRETR